MKSKVFWKWSIALLVMAPLLVLGASIWWDLGDLARGSQPATWTVTTVAEGGLAGKLVYNPDVAVDDGTVYVAWADQQGDADTFLSVSTDGGATWGKAINLSNNSGLSYQPAVKAVGSGIVCVAWQDETPGSVDILARCSTDRGATWLSNPVNVSNSQALSGYNTAGTNDWDGMLDIGIVATPACSTDGFPTVFVAWSEDDQMKFSVSTDGKAWGAPADLPFAKGVARAPSVYVAPDGTSFVAANDPAEIFVSRSATDKCGKTWEPAVNASNNAGASDAAFLAAIGNTVWAVYDDTTDAPTGKAAIRLATSNNRGDGGTWSDRTIGLGVFPDIAADGKNLYVIYSSRYGDPGPTGIIAHLCSIDQAASWKRDTIPGSNPSEIHFRSDLGINWSDPLVAADSAGNVYVTWMTRVAGQPITRIHVAKRTGC